MPPELTVVIPTRNRRERLERLLRSLDGQSAPNGDFEAIVVVDGATDGTEAMLKDFEAGYRLIVVSTAGEGPARARNEGAAGASGTYLLFLDDDMVADSELIAEHLRTQRQENGVVGLGRIDLAPRPRAGRWARFHQEERSQYFDSLRTSTPNFLNCWGGNLCLPRELFLAVGCFREELPGSGRTKGFPGHDTELGLRLTEHGARLVFVDTARSLEDDDETLRSAMRDRKSRGRLQLLKLEMHPSMLPHLHIGGQSELDMWSIGLRRLLLTLRIPPTLLLPFAAVVRGDERARRYYGLVLSYCRWVGVRKAADRDTWRRLRRGTIILMYHAIARDGEAPSRFVVSQRRFRSQMAWLDRAGYTVISLDELVRCMREHRLPPAKSVVLTFDDGYKDNLELAVPVLEHYGYPWTLFLPSAAGTRNGWSQEGSLQGRELIDIREAASITAGSLGAHGRTHVDLAEVSRDEAEREIAGSKAELEGVLGKPVTLFAYPYGKTSEAARRLVQEAGFEAACTIAPGPNRPATDPYMLHRSEIDGRDSLLRFATLLLAGDIRFNWSRRLR